MFGNLNNEVSAVLGLEQQAQTLTFLQIALRAIVVFFATLTIVRLGDKRFLARLAAFDVVLGFMLASMLARAINGTSAFWSTLAGGFVLVGLHRVLALAAYRWDWVGTLIKGRPDILVRDGAIDVARLRANRISETDLMQEARLNAGVGQLAHIGQATLERNGEVSVLRRGGGALAEESSHA